MCCSFKQFELSRKGRWSDCATNEGRFEEVAFRWMRGCNCSLYVEVSSAEQTSVDRKTRIVGWHRQETRQLFVTGYVPSIEVRP